MDRSVRAPHTRRGVILVIILCTILMLVSLSATAQRQDPDGVAVVRVDHPKRFICVLTTTSTTAITITGCGAPPAGTARFITDISIYGGAALALTSAASIQSGTGGDCATAPVNHYYCQHGILGGCEHAFTTPIQATTDGELCLFDQTVGTKFVTVSGFNAIPVL